MGALNFLSGRTVYLDTSILIYVVEHHSRYSPLLQPLVDAAASGELELLTSELTALETLILPLRSGDATLVQHYHAVPITRAVVLETARLRAQHPALRTPDAIHWATMRLEGADYLLTNDTQLAQTVGVAAVYLESLC